MAQDTANQNHSAQMSASMETVSIEALTASYYKKVFFFLMFNSFDPTEFIVCFFLSGQRGIIGDNDVRSVSLKRLLKMWFLRIKVMH